MLWVALISAGLIFGGLVFISIYNLFLHVDRSKGLYRLEDSQSIGRDSDRGARRVFVLTDFAANTTMLSGRLRLILNGAEMLEGAKQLEISLDPIVEYLTKASALYGEIPRDVIARESMCSDIRLVVKISSSLADIGHLFTSEHPVMTEIPLADCEYLSSRESTELDVWYVPSIPFELKAQGHPSAYPDDRYWLRPRVTIWLKDTRTNKLSRPFAVASRSLLVSEYPFAASGLKPLKNPESDEIILARERTNLVHVVMLLLLFFVLVWFMCGMLLNPTMRRRYGPAEGIAGAAAIMLSLLPIRAVIVPSEIEVLTTVDAVLGVFMAMLIGSVVMRIALGVKDDMNKRSKDNMRPARRVSKRGALQLRRSSPLLPRKPGQKWG